MNRFMQFVVVVSVFMNARIVWGQATYKVGYTSVVAVDTSRIGVGSQPAGRPVAVSVFYPVDETTVDGLEPDAVYQLDPIGQPTSTARSRDFEAHGVGGAYHAPPASSDGPFPIVMFSPGRGAPWFFFLYFATEVARHGFVVGVMSHFSDGTATATDVVLMHRPPDVSFALSLLLEKNTTPGDLLHELINTEQVAAAGHSFGGYTAMALAGGDDLVCDFVAQPNPATCVATQTDDRFKAIVLLDGSNQVLKFHELQRITLPSLGIGEDVLSIASSPLGVVWESWQARQHVAMSGEPNYRVDLGRSTHGIHFTNQCANILRRRDAGLISPEAAAELLRNARCEDPALMDYAEAHSIINQYAVAFLKMVLLDQHNNRFFTAGWAIGSPSDVQFFPRNEFAHGLEEDSTFLGDEFLYLRFQPGQEHEQAERGGPYLGTGIKDPLGLVPGEESFQEE